MRKGFTLIELLIVIAIVGIITSLTFIALNSVRSKSRDGKRISDIRQLQSALEMYKNDNNVYPTYATSGQPLVGPNNYTYTKRIPAAPGTNDGSCASDAYTYTTVDPNTNYSVTYCLGGAVQSAGPSNCTAVPGQICQGGAVVATTLLPPGTAGNDSGVGSLDWNAIDDGRLQGGSYASYSCGSLPKDLSVKLIVSGVVSGTDLKKVADWPDNGDGVLSFDDAVYGGASEMWGLALTPSIVNAADFGLAFAADASSDSYYLTMTGFSLNVPTNATIKGVEATVNRSYYWASGNSFAAGTMVSVPDGKKPIETLKIGDEVVARNQFGKLVNSKVSNLIIGQAGKHKNMVNLVIGQNKITATLEHKFLTKLGYRHAVDLKAGDMVYYLNDDSNELELLELTSVETISASIPVYNITVETWHNYIANGYVVSNFLTFNSAYVDYVKMRVFYQ